MADGRQQVVIPYRPRAWQAELHRIRKRFTVLVFHRRGGKTVFAANELIKNALMHKGGDFRGAYIAPLYRQAKQVVWDYVKHFSRPVPGTKFNESELRVDYPNGSRITLFGADNPDSLRGLYFDDVVLDEVAQMPPGLFEKVIRPALADRKGSALFIGTPQGHNFFYEIWKYAQSDPSWLARMYKASETGLLPDDELEAARTLMGEDEYEQEFECSFSAAITGAYYGKLITQAENAGRVGVVPWEPMLPVQTSWDLGIGDSTAIWFSQCTGMEIRIIDYYETSGVGLDHYAKVLRDKPYSYDAHTLPHDVRVKELSSGRTRLDTLQSLGLFPRIAPNMRIEDGINAVRTLFPRMWFDAEKCKDGLEALRQYRRDFDEKMKVFRSNPLHDWTSHAADAFRYFAVAFNDAHLEKQLEEEEHNFRWMQNTDGRSAVTGY